MKTITISRFYASGRSQFARQLGEKLGYRYVDEAFVRQIEQNIENVRLFSPA